jgi:hypothetical protein
VSALEPRVQATRYTVNCMPADSAPDAHVFELTVEWRGHDRWAIIRHGECLDQDGNWSWERLPSSREDEWLARHRFDLDTALELAKQAAPLVNVNGLTPATALARIERLKASEAAQ